MNEKNVRSIPELFGSQIQHRPGHAADGEELHHGHQHRCGNDAPEDLLLLLCHVGHFLP